MVFRVRPTPTRFPAKILYTRLTTHLCIGWRYHGLISSRRYSKSVEKVNNAPLDIFFILCSCFLENYRPVPCKTNAKPKRPADLKARAITDTQILLIWNKGLGYGYNYNITVKIGTTVTRTIYGMLSYGSATAVVIERLLPGQKYDFNVQHECASDLGKLSTPRPTSATTLTAGNFSFFKFFESIKNLTAIVPLNSFHNFWSIKSNLLMSPNKRPCLTNFLYLLFKFKRSDWREELQHSSGGTGNFCWLRYQWYTTWSSIYKTDNGWLRLLTVS